MVGLEVAIDLLVISFTCGMSCQNMWIDVKLYDLGLVINILTRRFMYGYFLVLFSFCSLSCFLCVLAVVSLRFMCT